MSQPELLILAGVLVITGSALAVAWWAFMDVEH